MVKITGYRRLSRRKGIKRKLNVRNSSYRKRYKRAATRNRRGVTLGKGFPKKVTMTHKYKTTISGNATGVLDYFHFRANGMFDPEVALGGHQPMYFDQMSALYDHWTVIGSKIKVTITRTGVNANDGIPLYFCMFLNDDTTVANSNIVNVAEANGARIVMAAPSPSQNFHPTAIHLYQKFSAKKTYGNATLNNDNIQGSAVTDPAEQTNFTLAYQHPGGGEGSFEALVEIDYIAVWTEVKDILAS